jgi:hypothetical protein
MGFLRDEKENYEMPFHRTWHDGHRFGMFNLPVSGKTDGQDI